MRRSARARVLANLDFLSALTCPAPDYYSIIRYPVAGCGRVSIASHAYTYARARVTRRARRPLERRLSFFLSGLSASSCSSCSSSFLVPPPASSLLFLPLPLRAFSAAFIQPRVSPFTRPSRGARTLPARDDSPRSGQSRDGGSASFENRARETRESPPAEDSALPESRSDTRVCIRATYT